MKVDVWTTSLRAIHEKAVSLYRGGERNDAAFFSVSENGFLASIGLKPINVYDYAEDLVSSGEPDWETYLLIVAVRRDYFLFEQKRVANIQEIRPDQLPARRATLGGIPWLPRIIAKARCFLQGALCHDIMFYCGGDRHFLGERKIHPADFLRVVWAANNDDRKILAFVEQGQIPHAPKKDARKKTA
jgi:hypothetical protein